MEEKIKLGISSCLLGKKVRYNGGHKLDRFLKDSLGRFVEWTPVCPEVECGLPIPREAMHLAGSPADLRLITRESGVDYTWQMRQWARDRLGELERRNDLCGFIFKSRSPSCGMRKTSDIAGASGVGIFARAYMEHFPLMPVEDDGRLNDPHLRENFIGRIFVFKRWKELMRKTGGIRDLVDFHSDHKLLILSRSPKHHSALGILVANTKKYQWESLQGDYLKILMEGLKLPATVKKNTNVLRHMMGYFKKRLQPDEKKELVEVLDNYHNGLVPLIVPVTLINHYVLKYAEQYLARQYYLNPHPVELMLRNHQ